VNSGSVAVLAGGLDSAALAVDLVSQFQSVHPVFVRQGLVWQEDELAHLHQFFEAVNEPRLTSVQVLELPVQDLYGDHWSLTGSGTPDATTPDAAVYLPGKNLMMLSRVAVWCQCNEVGTIALATLAANPFSDNSPAFYAAISQAIALALGTSIEIIRPYAELNKADVIRAASKLPLHLTFSCIHPDKGRHCGVCNKCAERKLGFEQSGVADRTIYAV